MVVQIYPLSHGHRFSEDICKTIKNRLYRANKEKSSKEQWRKWQTLARCWGDCY